MHTLFLLKVKKSGEKVTYHKKYLVGNYFDRWHRITYPAYMSSLNVNHRITREFVSYDDGDNSETIYHVSYFAPNKDSE